MSNWNNLSMQQRAEIMKLAVSNGIYDLGTIRDAYNEYAKGGLLPPTEEWTMEDENGYQIWRSNLPDNLKYTDDSQYNMREAYKAGLQPILNKDGYYHLGSRNPKTGKILKSATHPTLPLALLNDAQQGYYPTVDSRGNIYTQTWKGNELKEGGSIHIKSSHRGRLTELKERTGKSEAELYNDGNPAHKKMVVFARNARKWKHNDGGNLFDDGGGMFVKYVDSYRVNPETGGVYDKTGEVKEGAIILPEVEVVGRPLGNYAIQREAERMRDIQSNQGLSGADPVGQFAVETAALNPVFKLAGTAGLYGLGRYGERLTGFARPQNWARGKLIAREMNRSPFGSIGSPVLSPQVRTKVNGFAEDTPAVEWAMGYNTTPQITAENAASITPAQWTAAQDAAIARGDMAEAQRLRDLHFSVNTPDNFAVNSNGMPLDLYHGTRTGKHIRKEGFKKEMTGKGNRGASQGNTYLTNSLENAEYTGVKRHEVEPMIDKVTSVYDMFGSSKIPTIEELNAEIDAAWNSVREMSNEAHRIKTGSIMDRIGTRIGIKTTPTNRKNTLLSSVDQMEMKANELSRRSKIVDQLDSGLDFLSGNRSRSSVNTLNFIKEPINPDSPFRQIAADRVINALYNTQGLTYSPETLRLHAYLKNPLMKDYGMKPTDVNPLKRRGFDPVLQAYNDKELRKLKELSNPKYDGSITKNVFDVLFGDQYIVKDPRRIKLADAVTYDDKGVRIPLGLRDNFKLNNIRYGLLPFLGLGTLGTLYGKQE